MTKAKDTTVYTLKVALRNAKGIWRRIAIRGDQTLEMLHRIIFEAFDRYDEHLYSFYFPRLGARGQGRQLDATEYTDPRGLEDISVDRDLYNAATVTIGELKLEKGQSFDYLFDFGDSWEHLIIVEETDGRVDGGLYPRVLEKRGESPPQYPDLGEDEPE